MKSNTEALGNNKSLGDVLKIIRLDVFGLSLLDFGEIIGFSASSYLRFENNYFGKNFEKNKVFKLRSIAENISKAVFEECILQTFKVRLPEFLEPRERTKVLLRFKCPGEVHSFPVNIPFSTSICMNRYKVGVENIKFGILSNCEMSGIYIEQITELCDIIQLNIQYKNIESELRKEFESVFNDFKFLSHGFIYEIKNPEILGYRIYFKK